MIDLHCHLPYALSDGPKNIDESCKILQEAAKSHCTYINAVSHFGIEDNDLFDRVNKLKLYAEKYGISLHAGIEYDKLDFSKLEIPLIKHIGEHCNFILVDFVNDTIPFGAAQRIIELKESGVKVIVVHPEVLFSHDQIQALTQLVKSDAIIQLNASSFMPEASSKVRNFTFELIQRGLCHCVASDAHRPTGTRRWTMGQAFQIISKIFGLHTADLLFNINPQLLLQNRYPKPVMAKANNYEKFKYWFNSCILKKSILIPSEDFEETFTKKQNN